VEEEEAVMEDIDEDQRRRLKLEEALEIQSLRRIISAYLKYNHSFFLHSSINFYINDSSCYFALNFQFFLYYFDFKHLLKFN
jgi:hypothetical protein